MTNPSRLKCYRNAKYLAYVRGLPCCSCEIHASSEAAHVRKGNGGGVGLKPSDYRTVPLCRECHSHQHLIGEKTFWTNRGEIDTDFVIATILTSYVKDRRALIEALEQTIEAERNAN